MKECPVVGLGVWKSLYNKALSLPSMGLTSDLWAFIWEKKKFWLIPIIIMLILVGVLIIVSQSSSLSPFIYALF